MFLSVARILLEHLTKIIIQKNHAFFPINSTMPKKKFWFWCCVALLLVASSSISQQNSTSNEEKDDIMTVRYELDANSTINYGDGMKILRYDFYEKSTNNTQSDEHRTSFMNNDREDNDLMQYEFEMQSIKAPKNDSYMLMELRTNSTNDRKLNFTSQKIYRDLMRIEGNNDSTSYEFSYISNKNDNKYNIVPYERCDNIICIPLCCSLDNRLIGDKCIPEKNKILTPFFPNVYEHMNDSLQNENKRVDELFHLVVRNPCRRYYSLDSNYRTHSKYMFFTNGSLYLPYNHTFVESTSYCLAIMRQNKFDVITCSKTRKYRSIVSVPLDTKVKIESFSTLFPITYILDEYTDTINMITYIVSTLLSLGIFLVYSILPELRNIHSFILCMYSGLMIVPNVLHFITPYIIYWKYRMSDKIDIIIYFCSLTNHFWLTVMSFDMWWTFKKLRPLQRNVKQRVKRKLVIYLIYAWGSSFILTFVYVIKNLLPIIKIQFNLEKNPNFSNFISDHIIVMLYLYAPKNICIIISICLSIFTALKIRRYEKDIACHLRDSESRCFKENKKWFNLYLMLFVVMFIIIGTKCSMMTVYDMYVLYNKHYYDSYLFMDSISRQRYRAQGRVYYHYHVRHYQCIKIYILFLLDILLNLTSFILFVCKKRIIRLLLKRFGCQKCGLFPKTRHDTDAIPLSTSTNISKDMPMQEKINSCGETNCHEIHATDVTEL